MSKAEELLNSSSVAVYSSDNVETEPHIVIDKNRNVTVPDELKRIAVQHDHMIETVTFDCPRYWDKHDMSKMYIYVNYMRADGEKGSDLATNITIDETDDSIMHFDWTITGHLSAIQGSIMFLVCTQKMADDGTAENHWNSELNTDMYVSEGLEVESDISAVYPGIITQLLTRMDNVDIKTTDDAMAGYVDHYINNSQTSIKSIVQQNLAANGGTYFGDYMNDDPTGTDLMQDCVNEHLSANFERYFEYDNLVETKYGSDHTSTGNGLVGGGIENLAVGDDFGIATDYLKAMPSYDIFSVHLKANNIIDFSNGKLPQYNINFPTSETYFRMFVISYNTGKLIDIIDYDTLEETKMYRCTEDVNVYFTTEIHYKNTDVIFEVRQYIDFSDLQDIPQMKEDIKAVNNPIVKTYKGSAINYKHYYLHGIDSLSVGDEWLGFSGYLTTSNNEWYSVMLSMKAGQTLDFSKGVVPTKISDGYDKMIVVKSSDPSHIADVVDFKTLKSNGSYYFDEDSSVGFCSEINFTDNETVFNIRQTTDYQSLANDIADIKKVVGNKSITLIDSGDTSKSYEITVVNGVLTMTEVE